MICYSTMFEIVKSLFFTDFRVDLHDIICIIRTKIFDMIYQHDYDGFF